MLLHGITAYPDSQAYANWHRSHDDPKDLAEHKNVHNHQSSPRVRLAIDKEMSDTSGQRPR